MCSGGNDEVYVYFLEYGTTEFVARSDVVTQLPTAVKKSASVRRIYRCQLDGVSPV